MKVKGRITYSSSYASWKRYRAELNNTSKSYAEFYYETGLFDSAVKAEKAAKRFAKKHNITIKWEIAK